MNTFLRELEVGEIHLRDKWQFELKSEFFAIESGVSTCTQEFYLFIPNSLQTNQDTYSKTQFYQDQTNLIRYKTPEFRLAELIDKTEARSPLVRLEQMKDLPQTPENERFIKNELKLLGNVVRSSLRERIREVVNNLEKADHKIDKGELETLCLEIEQLRRLQINLFKYYLKNWEIPAIQSHVIYLDEFISNSIDYYLTGLLKTLLDINHSADQESVIEDIYYIIAEEKRYREEFLHIPSIHYVDSVKNETIMYRRGLLNKFVLDALILPTVRFSLDKRFRNLIGSFSAGIAMLVFLILFIWQGEVFLINSLPFVLITVILYILKDRMKEGLKAISYRQFLKWFSDYTTDIRSPDQTSVIGKFSESFSFIKESRLPKEIIKIRNKEFHSVLETFKRPEQVIYYKKIIKMYPVSKSTHNRRNALNLIFRFNISHFLRMADDPVVEYVTVENNARELHMFELPKVYHINMIMKNTYTSPDGSTKIELKKIRLIVDKNGIKRVEFVRR